jgi:dTDP-4-amino-4,6-dideoxygalactose transaminase
VIFPTPLKTDARSIVRDALAANLGRHPRPVPFIEQKSPDFEQMAEIVQLSADSGYWTNFGPVSALLESALEQHLHLPASRAVVMCSSGTAALHTLVAAKEYRAGRRLRWVVSAYGFRASYLGPLANARVLDCNAAGVLDLEALDELDPECWDGAVVTNTFGLRSDLSEYAAFCRDAGKELIVDNAGLLDGFRRDNPRSSVDEILSFHQTKPWGMGEGGCAVLPREQASLFRAIINGGEGLQPEARLWASNSKISDVSCAMILQRLRHAGEWSGGYRTQGRRILRIASEVGLRPLAPIDLARLTPPHLPMLAPSPVTAIDLVNKSFVMQKYYEPLSPELPTAASLYARVVNIPCHPDMALLHDEEIRLCLERLPGCRPS